MCLERLQPSTQMTVLKSLQFMYSHFYVVSMYLFSFIHIIYTVYTYIYIFLLVCLTVSDCLIWVLTICLVDRLAACIFSLCLYVLFLLISGALQAYQSKSSMGICLLSSHSFCFTLVLLICSFCFQLFFFSLPLPPPPPPTPSSPFLVCHSSFFWGWHWVWCSVLSVQNWGMFWLVLWLEMYAMQLRL